MYNHLVTIFQSLPSVPPHGEFTGPAGGMATDRCNYPSNSIVCFCPTGTIMWKYDVIHNVMYCSVNRAEISRSHSWHVQISLTFCTCGFWDIWAKRQADKETDRQTDRNTDRHVDHNTLHPYKRRTKRLQYNKVLLYQHHIMIVAHTRPLLETSWYKNTTLK